jgi:hypothetical protein
MRLTLAESSPCLIRRPCYAGPLTNTPFRRTHQPPNLVGGCDGVQLFMTDTQSGSVCWFWSTDFARFELQDVTESWHVLDEAIVMTRLTLRIGRVAPRAPCTTAAAV